MIYVTVFFCACVAAVLMDRDAHRKSAKLSNWANEKLAARITEMSVQITKCRTDLQELKELKRQIISLAADEAELKRQVQSDRTELHARIMELRDLSEKRMDETASALSNFIQDFDKRIDHCEEKLDVPKKRRVWTGSFAKGRQMAETAERAKNGSQV